MARIVFNLLLGGWIFAAGCGGAPPKRTAYARATPVAEAPAAPAHSIGPIAMAQATHTFGSGGAPPRAPSAEEPEANSPSYQVIDNANRAAAQGPEQAAYLNAIQEYIYVPGTLYQLYTAPMRVTDISLQPGEQIIGQPASGDVVRWVLAVGKSKQDGVVQQHVYLKPTRPGLHTNLVINTDKRSYFLELHSYKETYMASVKWRYPQDEIAQLASQSREVAASRQTSSPIVSLENLNFGYEIEVEDGDPRWTPTQVFDDGKKTFIRFPPDMLVREAPALFVMRDDETQIVNYRMKKDLYVVDRLFEAAELRVGQDDQEIVRIERTDD